MAKSLRRGAELAHRRHLRPTTLWVGGLFLASCGAEVPAPRTVRLTDLYQQSEHATAPPVAGAAAEPQTVWTFGAKPGAPSTGPEPGGLPAAAAATLGFQAVSGIENLRVRDGKLVGRTTSKYAVLYRSWPEAIKERDSLHALELRLRVSGGAKAYAGYRAADSIDLSKLIAEEEKALAAGWDGGSRTAGLMWNFSGKLPAPGVLETIELTTSRSVDLADLRHLLLRPTDAPGVDFEIEFLRAVRRGEHLAKTPSGLSFQGLGQIYHETLVERPGESMRFALRAPQRARFETALGAVENGETRFRLRVSAAGGADRIALERTLTRPHRWEPVTVDLSEYGGKDVDLTLEVEGTHPNALGFWGAPALRSPLAAAAAPAATPRHVILVMADTLRRDSLGCYGAPRAVSPMIDRLAGEGARFDRMVSNATWTKVAAPTLLTGLYPPTHGVREFEDRIAASAETMAEAFRAADWATVSLSSVVFSGRLTNLHQGFEELHESSSLDLPEAEVAKTARDYVDRLLPWLEAHRDVPSFVYLHLLDPHDPFEPRRPYATLWADAAKRAQHLLDAKKLKEAVKDPLRGRGLPWREDYAAAGLDADRFIGYERAWYDGSIRGMDAELGRLVARIRDLGLEKETLLVFVADHGEEFLEHGRAFHGQSVYAELADIPFILWAPGRIAPGTVVEARTQLVDVMPTILELAGLAIPDAVQGQSLVRLLSTDGQASFRQRPAFVQKAKTRPLKGPAPMRLEMFAVLDGNWKLVHNVERDPRVSEFELYDTEGDPGERRDVAAANPDAVAALAKLLAGWRAQTEAAKLLPEESGKGMSEEELQRLRSLGYIN